MKTLNIHTKLKCITLLVFLLFSCGTKTKSSSETDSELKVADQTKAIEEKKKFDSLKVALIEEAKREFQQIANEKLTEEGSRITTTEVTETIKSPAADFRPVEGTDLFLNEKTGQVLERKTKTVIEEKFKAEQLKQLQTKIIEEENRKKDSVAFLRLVDTKIEAHNSHLEKKIRTIVSNKERKAWEPSLKLVIGTIIFIVLLLISLFSWLKCGNPFSWLFLIFKRKNKLKNG